LQEIINTDPVLGNAYAHRTREQVRGLPFYEYFLWWVNEYKVDHITQVTLAKYHSTAKFIWLNFRNMYLSDLDKNRRNLQKILDEYGKTHRHLTTLDFKAQIYASLHSAVEDEFINSISTSQIVIHSVEDNWTIAQRNKERNKVKTLSASEYRTFKTRIDIDLEDLLKERPDWPRLNAHIKTRHPGCNPVTVQAKLMTLSILLHTGCRFAEAIGLTMKDIHEDSISINKTWDYKNLTGYNKTKNDSSVRTEFVDDLLIRQIHEYNNWKTKYFGDTEYPIVVEPNTFVYSDTYNAFFRRLQKKYGITANLSIHKIRHTYISYLLNEGVSAESIAKQVGHTDTSMIQKVYGHLMKERQEEDRLRIKSLMR